MSDAEVACLRETIVRLWKRLADSRTEVESLRRDIARIERVCESLVKDFDKERAMWLERSELRDERHRAKVQELREALREKSGWKQYWGLVAREGSGLPLHRTEVGYPYCATCDGGGCPDCTDPA